MDGKSWKWEANKREWDGDWSTLHWMFHVHPTTTLHHTQEREREQAKSIWWWTWKKKTGGEWTHKLALRFILYFTGEIFILLRAAVLSFSLCSMFVVVEPKRVHYSRFSLCCCCCYFFSFRAEAPVLFSPYHVAHGWWLRRITFSTHPHPSHEWTGDKLFCHHHHRDDSDNKKRERRKKKCIKYGRW